MGKKANFMFLGPPSGRPPGADIGGGAYAPQPRFGGGANRPTNLEMVGGGAYGGAKAIGGGAKPKNFRGAIGAAKKTLYTLLFTFYCIFKNKFSKNGQF